MGTILQTLLDWIAVHPHAFSAVVFAIALMESLVVLGLLIPGAFLLFGAGALIASGVLPLYPIMFWTILGAFTGDLVSFLLGHYYHQRLRVMWPFRRYPELVNRGVDFFVCHGGKSIFMARFIGPIRPIVPAIAGMMNMTTPRFVAIDFIACLLWAPVYILPGVVFGASIGLAAEVAGRLAVLLVAVAASVWLGIWLIGGLIRVLRPHALNMMEELLMWSRNHPHIGALAGSLLDPDHPETRGLATLSLLSFAALWLMLLISRHVLSDGQWEIDNYVYHTLASLRTPWADNILVFFSLLGDRAFLAFIVIGCCSWLFVEGCRKAAIHWLAAWACAGLLTWILKVSAGIERPLPLVDGYSFPSAHAGMSMVVYGFLGLLIAREMPLSRRWLPYLCAGLLIAPIAFSRIYLGVHWFSDIIAGLTLGLFWLALIGIAYDRHPAPRLPAGRLLGIALLLLSVGTSFQLQRNYLPALQAYTPAMQAQTVSQADWLVHDWKALPAWRLDLEDSKELPINLQWAGSLQTLQRVLTGHGWMPVPGITLYSAMNWLAPAPDISTLPILPEVHDGRHQVLMMVAPHGRDEHYLTVLRLWPSDRQLRDSGQTIWLGKAGRLELATQLPMISYLRAAPGYDAALDLLARNLQGQRGIHLAPRMRQQSDATHGWHGRVLLAWESPT